MTFKKPDPNELLWIIELEKAIDATSHTKADTAALKAACAELKASSKELEGTMNEAHEACKKLTAGGAARKFAPARPFPASPPRPSPGSPIPIPYPNLSAGSADVRKKVAASERALQKQTLAQQKLEQVVNQQMAKLSAGDEHAKRGVVTAMGKGKAYFRTWSMNVKAESKAVVRHLDTMKNLR